MIVNPHNAAAAATPGAAESAGTQGVSHGTDSRSTRSEGLAPDRLELSGLVSNMSRAEAAGLATRAAYVKQIAKLYKAGGYEADPGSLSQSLIRGALNNRATGGGGE
jgi:hypothetical protein